MLEAGAANVNNDEETTPDGSEILLKDMMGQMKETEHLIMNEAQRGEDLTCKIYDINSWNLFADRENSKDWSWEVKQEVEKLKMSITEYELLIKCQTQRMQHLRKNV